MDLKNYVTVADRLAEAYRRWPDLRVTESDYRLEVLDGAMYLAVQVTVWRAPDDSHPTVAWAWEPWPGRTPYTKNSEYMVGATSALGRALGYMGCGSTGSIASADEVAARQAYDAIPPAPNEPVHRAVLGARAQVKKASQPQLAKLSAVLEDLGVKDRDSKLAKVADMVGRQVGSSSELSTAEAAVLIGRLEGERERLRGDGAE